MGNFLFFLVLLFPFNPNGVSGMSVLSQDVLDASYMTVQFIPRVFSTENEQLYGYSDKDIMTMLDVVSTRFTRLCAPGYGDKMNENNPENYIQPGFHTISKLVAKRNKDAAQDGNKTLEIGMVINAGIINFFPSVIRKIAQVNSIFEGTVYSVILQPTDLEMQKGNDLKTFLDYFRSKLNKINVKLGIEVDYSYCDRFNQVKKKTELVDGEIVPVRLPHSIMLPKRTRDILKSVDFISFIETAYIYAMPERTVERFKQVLTLCEKSVEIEMGKEFPVHSVLEIESKPVTKLYSPEKLAKTWKLLGEMASEKKRDVFMVQAFDTPYEGLEVSGVSEEDSTGYTGWWALRDENATEITTESFIEKYEMRISDLLGN